MKTGEAEKTPNFIISSCIVLFFLTTVEAIGNAEPCLPTQHPENIPANPVPNKQANLNVCQVDKIFPVLLQHCPVTKVQVFGREARVLGGLPGFKKMKLFFQNDTILLDI